jgi:hypothetical protein
MQGTPSGWSVVGEGQPPGVRQPHQLWLLVGGHRAPIRATRSEAAGVVTMQQYERLSVVVLLGGAAAALRGA